MYVSKGFVPLRRCAPESSGMPPVALAAFERALERSTAAMRGYMLLRGGAVIGEKFWPPYKGADRVWVYSISKSFTATAVGFAVSEGRLGIDDKVTGFFPAQCPAEISENLANMRVRDLLSMTSGHGQDTLPAMLAAPQGDWVRALLALPVPHAPGTHFMYNTGASYLLSAIVQSLTGQPLPEYLAPRLFEPLGFDDVEWEQSPQGISAGGWGILVRLEDLAKLGQLYLDGGLFGGRRVLDEAWVAMATSKQADNANNANPNPDWTCGYGFQFWRCRHGAFRADGAAGQYCVVLPRQNAVLAMMSETADMQELMDILWAQLLPRFDTGASVREQALNGAVYRLQANPYGALRATFHFEPQRLTLSLETEQGASTLTAGRGAWLDGESPLPFGTPRLIPLFAMAGRPSKTAAYFVWPQEDTLEIHWVYRDTPHSDQLVCRFTGGGLSLCCPPSPAGAFAGAKAAQLTGTV